jgi:L-lactate dehydrogenase complex protein LldG
MTDERTLLGRIAAQLRRGDDPARHAEPTAAPEALSAPSADRAALLARFTAEWRGLAGHTHQARSAADAAGVIAGICEARGASVVLGWSEAAIGVAGLEGELAARGITVDHGIVPRAPDARAARLQALAEIAVGVTGADALLAESGSAVLASGPGRPRTASLLPPVHVTVVGAPRIFLSLEHLLADDPSLGGAGSNLVAISGPSRTADIEMTLTRGVHGPGEVHVILVGGA